MSEKSEKKLATKLVSILETMAGVPKKGYNKNQNYHYMREVDVLEALKEELVKHKIILLTSSKHIETKDKPKIDKNENKVVEFVTTVETSHTFIDSESGEQLSITSIGQGYDSLDKGASKAITAATKYALMKTFMISDEGADNENDGVTQQAPTKGFTRTKTETALTTTPPATQPEVKIPTKETPPEPAPIKPGFSRRGATTGAKQEPNFP